ncbi:MAG: EamA family transporter [Clostridia bacterium]|nr:EamA family transporter [Clostridia bacterium]
MPVLLIVLSRIVNQFESIFIKKYNSKHTEGGFIFTAIVSLVSGLFFLAADLVSDASGLTFTLPVVGYAVAAGVSFALASILTYVALGCGSFVLSRLVLSYGILITIGQGLVMGESVSLWGWTGIGLVVLSLFFVKGNNNDDKVSVTAKWVVTIGLSVVFAGVFGILQRYQQVKFSHAYDNEFMLLTLVIAAAILFVIGIIINGKDMGCILKNGSLYAVGAGLSNGATNFLTLFVYTLAPMSFVAPMNAGTGIIISFIISKIIFKEKFSLLQYIGVVLGGVALVLFQL